MAKETENLDSFGGWEETTETMDFFGSSEEVVSFAPKDVVEEANKDGEEAPKQKTEEENNAEAQAADESSFFGETEEEAADLGNPNPDDEGDGEEGAADLGNNDESEGNEPLSGSLGTLAYLKEKGHVDYELEEGEELTEEKAGELIEENFEAGIEDRVGELFEDLPQAVKDLNKFAMAGGNVNLFFAKMAEKSAKNAADLDMSVEANQEIVVRNSLKAEGYDDDYINTQVDFLKDSKKLEKFAASKKAKQDEAAVKAGEELAKSQAAARKAYSARLKKTKTDLSGNLKDMEDVKGISLTKKDKKELPTYMVDRNVKLENGSTITTMQKDLMEALQDEGKALFIAKLLRTDFDLSGIQAQAEGKVTKKVRDGIRRNAKDTKGGRSTGRNTSKPKKSLEDYF